MRKRWMLVDTKTNKLWCWIAFPTKGQADNYRMIDCKTWLRPPYFVNGELTEMGKRIKNTHIKPAIIARDRVKAICVSIKPLGKINVKE